MSDTKRCVSLGALETELDQLEVDAKEIDSVGHILLRSYEARILLDIVKAAMDAPHGGECPQGCNCAECAGAVPRCSCWKRALAKVKP